MLISFTVENWMSFRDPVTLNMVATRERQHRERVAKIGKNSLSVLPVAAIYGGNASGKSNFYKALEFAKNFIINGPNADETIQVEPFRLDPNAPKSPTRFLFSILIGKTLYEFSFSLTSQKVIEEKLIKIDYAKEECIYEHKNGKIKFYKDNPIGDMLFRSTRKNQLYLTSSILFDPYPHQDILDWFKNDLILISPQTNFTFHESLYNEESCIFKAFNDVIDKFDTGISRLSFIDFPIEKFFPDQNQIDTWNRDISEGSVILKPWSGIVIAISKIKGKIAAKIPVNFHIGIDNNEVLFFRISESEGTNRLFDLLPVFLDLSNEKSNKVIVIDELNRSLHTLLTRQLLESYLDSCTPETRSQLIFTTHDVMLMDQDLLRRDEMWVTERDKTGNTTLYSFSEFKDIRFDKDIRKSYLQGRLGGVPKILLYGAFRNPCEDDSAGSTKK